jgi:hypothetical protein
LSEKKSGAALFRAAKRSWLHLRDEALDLIEYFRFQLVVNPPSVLSVAHNPGVLENAKMERQTRLRRVQRIGELADASFAIPEQLNDVEPSLIGERVKELDRAFGTGVSRYSHGLNISK